MSRIGLKPIAIPPGVKVELDGNAVKILGQKGSLTRFFHVDMLIKHEGDNLIVERPSEKRQHKALHGTTRSLLFNMVTGVVEGFTKKLELVGVGYRAAKKGENLSLTVGYSHPIDIVPEEGISFDVPSTTQIIVQGIDKERVGSIAAKIRSIRPPEPYKGKGIRYSGEFIRIKEGKTGKK